ncbi:MAG: PH domain-containing protein [Propionibacteriales bacterium]|nr:PH domain-containing protein [Propionibacteriales bacterium]
MPADSDGRAPVSLPRTYRPRGTRVVAVVAATTLVGAVTFLWSMLPGSVRDEFTVFQRMTVLALFAGIVVVLYGLFRTSARADESGLRVVNIYKARQLEWPQVISLSLNPNRPWAMLDLADGTTLAVMAIQNADGARASRSARELAGLIAGRSGTD